jgi:hypothetical protein
MTNLPRYTVVSILSIVVGFFACRMLQNYDAPKHVPSQSSSTFEFEALGFVNWYRIEGRDAIPHEVLIRNLHILESKAVASGQLISTRTAKKSAEQVGSSNGG